jgi:hypothetical protein
MRRSAGEPLSSPPSTTSSGGCWPTPCSGRCSPRGAGARHRAYVVTILGEALGGPEHYGGPDLAGAHRGLGISDTHFDRAAAHLHATLDGLGVPRRLSDHIVGIVAGLRPAVVTA